MNTNPLKQGVLTKNSVGIGTGRETLVDPRYPTPRVSEYFCRHVGGVAKTKTKETKTNTMTTLEIKGDWNITKGKLKQKWAKLTDDDLQLADGKHEELLGRIQKRTGETREAVEKAVKEAASSCSCN